LNFPNFPQRKKEIDSAADTKQIEVEDMELAVKIFIKIGKEIDRNRDLW
jgi:hypothetical protein